jgi:hypothetical protein
MVVLAGCWVLGTVTSRKFEKTKKTNGFPSIYVCVGVYIGTSSSGSGPVVARVVSLSIINWQCVAL